VIGIKNVGLHAGAVAPREPLFDSIEEATKHMDRHYKNSFEFNVAPVQNVGNYRGALSSLITGAATWDGVMVINQMRATPTITFFNPLAANAFARDVNAGVDAQATEVIAGASSEKSIFVRNQANAGSAIYNIHCVHWVMDARL
jgi:hypothetical protein